ncbi:uncharacterized protein LOC126816729 [Patella vulgata]|uniref:uncharacterized protein LOC126816729 n=1 Tax=Patella vulgata TaxID=6465 RepID=UPI00217FD561|nr:uncharacterized protein LOC126816729 [Patella vulgata]
MIRFDVKRYEDNQHSWQQAVLLDQLQIRSSVVRSDCYDKRLADQKLVSKRWNVVQSVKPLELIEKLRNNTFLVWNRPCPGYVGFIPRVPPAIKIKNRENLAMMSTMKATYRTIPGYEYIDPTNFRQGAFSKTVTLTYPFNPYNKISDTKLIED